MERRSQSKHLLLVHEKAVGNERMRITDIYGALTAGQVCPCSVHIPSLGPHHSTSWVL